MVAFEAGAVIGMLAIVETSVAGLGWYVVRNAATEEDVDDVAETADEAAREAAAAGYEAAEARRGAEQAHDRLDALSANT
ncbi:hypothetical protein [Halobaculum magnesiiphilum]|uniref:Uncharacterized protein n=1 Tax=Halobaculum magnesiiphilum TaxID=1017351 RepID=A0A8T8WDD7_9EURY|nr:hypothetical protein [Halobaculum magnesiiphilum]QZP37744.1 hypothetical protein K6T50_00760 [Halobaculum magnesiiphilum]